MSVIYIYQAVNKNGKLITSQIVAQSKKEAYQQLIKKQLEPILLEEKDKLNFAKKSDMQILLLAKEKSLPIKIQVRIFKKLAVLAKAHAPLLECLSICARQETQMNAKEYIHYLEERVRSGIKLSDAISEKNLFNSQLTQALILAAEFSGDYGHGFTQIATTREAEYKHIKEIINQLIYPVILAIFVIITLFFVSFFVLPQFEEIFEYSQTQIPLFTSTIIAIGKWIREWSIFFPLFIVILAAIIKKATSHNKNKIDELLLKAPLIGNFLILVTAERLCRSLGALLKGGVPLAGALTIAIQVITSPTLRKYSENMANQVKNGKNMHVAAKQSMSVPDEVVSLIEIGERTGRLPEMLLNAADLCKEETEFMLKKFTAIMGPLLTAIAGGTIALVISAILMGILSLNEAIY